MEISKIMPFYRWHPEVALRYLPIVARLKQSGLGTVLEVGSGSLGIAPYLNWNITGLDEDFSGPKHPKMTYVKSTGENIPFADLSFDYVISVDTFEHVPKDSRSKIIAQMMRVAKKMIIIAAPMGELSQKQDEQLAGNYLKKFGQEFPFLSEHKKYKLPEVEDIKDAIIEQAKLNKTSVEIQIFGNENMTVRKFLMEGWMTKNLLVNIFFRKILLLFLPIYQFFDTEPYYRSVFFVTISR